MERAVAACDFNAGVEHVLQVIRGQEESMIMMMTGSTMCCMCPRG